jgi:hypothetical protein
MFVPPLRASTPQCESANEANEACARRSIFVLPIEIKSDVLGKLCPRGTTIRAPARRCCNCRGIAVSAARPSANGSGGALEVCTVSPCPVEHI